MAAIDEIIKGATGTDVEQCKNMTKSLKPIVSETLADAYNCVDSRVKTAVDTWKDLYQRSQESLKALIQVKNDVEDCVEGDTNWRTSLCVSKVGFSIARDFLHFPFLLKLFFCNIAFNLTIFNNKKSKLKIFYVKEKTIF